MEPAILIVDDDQGKRLALRAILDPLDVRVDEAGSAADALRRLLAVDYAVVLIDVRMPEIDGFELAALMRERPRSADTPIIFITAAADIDPLRAYDRGAVDFLTPPIVPSVLRSKVTVFLRLARLLEREQEASRAKTDFLSLAAHELRGPLGVASGYLALLLEGNLGPPPERWEEPLRIVELKLGELRHLSDELVDAARIDNHALAPRLQELDVRDLARAAVNRARPKARMLKGGVELLSPLEAVNGRGDPMQLARVLDNLLENALTYGGQPPIVTVTVGPDAAIRVADCGRGIASADRETIFDRFKRLPEGERRSAAGTGLGLFLSRALARANGGDVVLESSSRSGSVFALRLQAGAVAKAKSKEQSARTGGVVKRGA